jgi:hypothetical protein
MTEPSGVIRQISWRDLFPWLILLRTFRIAIGPSLLAVATVAVLVTPLGWRLAHLVFLRGEAQKLSEQTPATFPQAANSRLAAAIPAAVRGYFPAATTAVLEAYFDLAEPLARFFQLKMSLREAAYYAFGTLWTLALWAFPGGSLRGGLSCSSRRKPQPSRRPRSSRPAATYGMP